MKKYIKEILKILGILIIWLLGGLFFRFDPTYYSLLKIPSFALPPVLISIIWFIIYILISISIYLVMKKTNILKTNDYMYVLLTNYLANQLFTFVFFTLKSPFLGFIMTTIVLISGVFLYLETMKIEKKASYFLIPYVIYSIYAFILSLSVYILNF